MYIGDPHCKEHVMPQRESAYDANLPANVRHDKNLTPTAKLVYVEIRALCSARGYCWAETAHFEELFGMTERGMMKVLGLLERSGYIVRRRAENGERHIYLAEALNSSSVGTELQFSRPPSPLIYNHTQDMGVTRKKQGAPKPTAQYKDSKLVVDPLFLAELGAVYEPASIQAELPKMERWLAFNKPKKDYRRFITNWLSNALDRKSNNNKDLQQSATRMYEQLDQL